MHYANLTLDTGELSVVVYLPESLRTDVKDPSFYAGSRFDHSSMIGSVKRTTGDGRHHTLFGTDMWRIPHNEHWPESGVGLAAEFGVGDNGAFCFFHCGWQQGSDITNGVLGYTEAKLGEPFLKIGVGILLKGTCPECDSAGDYKFNSPYLFAEEPQWKMEAAGPTSVKMKQEIRLRQYGYKLVKEISLTGSTLAVTTSLTNLGQDAFSTVWYSHNFFTCDGDAIGPGYALDMDLAGENRDPVYEEPGTWSWSTPLRTYARVIKKVRSIRIEWQDAIPPGPRIKSEFLNDGKTTGAFRLEACGTTIESTLHELQNNEMYAYNLYVERGTLSPEPQFLLHLAPGETKTWTQRLVFGDLNAMTATTWLASLSGVDTSFPLSFVVQILPLLLAVVFFSMTVAFTSSWNNIRRRGYQSV
jgi:hypothetical protein